MDLNGRALFAVDDGVHGEELWISDGTAAGTVLVKDSNPGKGAGAGIYWTKGQSSIGSRWFYFDSYNPTTGFEPWRTDGTAAGTTRVADIHPGSGSSSVNQFSRGARWRRPAPMSTSPRTVMKCTSIVSESLASRMTRRASVPFASERLP